MSDEEKNLWKIQKVIWQWREFKNDHKYISEYMLNLRAPDNIWLVIKDGEAKKNKPQKLTGHSTIWPLTVEGIILQCC